MSKTPRRLGRGLSSILSITDTGSQPSAPYGAVPPGAPAQPAPITIKVSQLRPNPSQPRRDMPAENLKALADSIAKTGVIQPIAVRPAGDNTYEIIAGERRWRAAQMAGLAELPAIIREATNEEMLEFALVENIFREDLNAIDRALAYRRYCDEFDLTAEQVAERLGEDRSTVANYLRILDLPSEVKTWVAEGKLAMGHARCVLALPVASDRMRAAKTAIEKDLSVRALEKLVNDLLTSGHPAVRDGKAVRLAKRPLIRQLEEAFVHTLGTKVEINESRRKGKGKIIIYYGSLDDFDRISERLGISPDAE